MTPVVTQISVSHYRLFHTFSDSFTAAEWLGQLWAFLKQNFVYFSSCLNHRTVEDRPASLYFLCFSRGICCFSAPCRHRNRSLTRRPVQAHVASPTTHSVVEGSLIAIHFLSRAFDRAISEATDWTRGENTPCRFSYLRSPASRLVWQTSASFIYKWTEKMTRTCYSATHD